MNETQIKGMRAEAKMLENKKNCPAGMEKNGQCGWMQCCKRMDRGQYDLCACARPRK